MDTYKINGVDVEYDTFDLDNMEALEEAVNAVVDGVTALQERKDGGESAVKILRDQANLFLDFFDDVLGDGAAKKIFGNRINILDIANGYKEFTDTVAAKNAQIKNAIGTPMNREHRRRMKRET